VHGVWRNVESARPRHYSINNRSPRKLDRISQRDKSAPKPRGHKLYNSLDTVVKAHPQREITTYPKLNHIPIHTHLPPDEVKSHIR
jgi:hypothetical protein